MNKVLSYSFEGLLGLTILSGLVLSSIRVSADEITRVSNVTVSVPASCNISGENTTHSANVSSGTYQTDIGLTTLTVFCNDAEGFSIYAIGYSNQEYGNTKLLATVGGVLSPSNDIVTGTATGSNANDPSNWAMKLKTPTSGDTAIIVGSTGDSEKEVSTPDFSTYVSVPSNYTRVAYKNSTTDVTNGTKVQSTYAAYISPSQPSGDYDGKVKYTLVHPADAATPLPHEPCSSATVCYHSLPSDTVGTMGNQPIGYSANYVFLSAPNFSRSGYGFAGWNTSSDYSGETYGPNQQLTFTSGEYNNKGLNLYAEWVQSSGYLQNWNGCTNLSNGDVTALTDQRDGQTYAVAKLADGRCWMIENLRLDSQYTTGSTNEALAQGYKDSGTDGKFIGLASSEAYTSFSSGGTPQFNSLYSVDGRDGTENIGSSYYNYRMPRYNNMNTAERSSDVSGGDGWSNVDYFNDNIYGYGNYYNFAAASANTEFTGQSQLLSLNYSICPTGWGLPSSSNSTSDTGREMIALNNAVTQNNKKLTDYPNNFLNKTGGLVNMGEGTQIYYRGSLGLYWDKSAYGIHLNYDGNLNLYFSAARYDGYPVRCILQNSQ